MSSATTIEATASDNVAGSRSRISAVTGSPLRKLTPRSPVTACPIQVKYCATQRLVQPGPFPQRVVGLLVEAGAQRQPDRVAGDEVHQGERRDATPRSERPSDRRCSVPPSRAEPAHGTVRAGTVVEVHRLVGADLVARSTPGSHACTTSGL